MTDKKDDDELKAEFAKEISADGKEIFLELYDLLVEKFGQRSVASVAFACTMLDFYFIENLIKTVGEDKGRKMSTGFIKAAPLAIEDAFIDKQEKEELELGINMPSDKDIVH